MYTLHRYTCKRVIINNNRDIVVNHWTCYALNTHLLSSVMMVRSGELFRNDNIEALKLSKPVNGVKLGDSHLTRAAEETEL